MAETAFIHDKRVTDWLGHVLEGYPSYTVTSTDPAALVKEPSHLVSLYLMAIGHPPAYSTGQRRPLKLLERFLVTTWAPDVTEANEVLLRLIFEALDSPELDVQLDPLTPSDWRSFGTAPRPAFILNVPVEHPRPIPDMPLVRAPLTVQAGSFVGLHGQVLGPADTPMVGALVDYPALSLSVQTDRNGRFQFAAVPGEAVPKVLRVIAKGRAYQVTVTGSTSAAEPFIIRVDFSR